MLKNVKCIVIGDGAVGKTSLLLSYTTNSFPNEYIVTVFDNYSVNIKIEEEIFNLQLWDTAGQENYSYYRKLTYPNTDVILLCFSLNSRSSFDNIVTDWVPEIEEHLKNIPIILVGTKMDLREENLYMKEMITTNEGRNLQKKIKAIEYIECSSKNHLNLSNIFETICKVSKIPKTNNSETMDVNTNCNCIIF